MVFLSTGSFNEIRSSRVNETVAIPNYSKIPTASLVQKRKMRGTKAKSECWQVVMGLLLLLIAELPFECGGREYNLCRGESKSFNDNHSICNGKNSSTD